MEGDLDQLIDPLFDHDIDEQLQTQLNQMAGSDALQLFLSAKQVEAGVTINTQLLESLLSQTGGHGGY